MMTFEIAYKWVFLLLPLPLLVVVLIQPFKIRNTSLFFPQFNHLSKATGIKGRKSAWISKRNIYQWIVLSVIWVLVLSSLSSPQLVGQAELTTKTTRSFLIAADLSFSMDTRDWQIDGKRVSRWEGVRDLMSDFVQGREGDQIGLVFFGTNAYMQAPLTPDIEVIEWNLKETEVGMAGQTTGIGNAIGYSVKLFKEDTLPQKVMLLLTDGVDSGSDIAPLDAAYLAKADSIVIYTLGIGDPTQSGADLDETTLKEIANITGGKYFLAQDTEQLTEAYEILDELEPIEYEEEEYKPVVLLYYYPLAVALVIIFMFLLVSFIINRLRKA